MWWTTVKKILLVLLRLGWARFKDDIIKAIDALLAADEAKKQRPE